MFRLRKPRAKFILGIGVSKIPNTSTALFSVETAFKMSYFLQGGIEDGCGLEERGVEYIFESNLAWGCYWKDYKVSRHFCSLVGSC